MFSAGIAQQMIRRQERMSRVVTHLQKGDPCTVNGGTCVNMVAIPGCIDTVYDSIAAGKIFTLIIASYL